MNTQHLISEIIDDIETAYAERTDFYHFGEIEKLLKPGALVLIAAKNDCHISILASKLVHHLALELSQPCVVSAKTLRNLPFHSS